ncbi:thioesterase II family protein [Streptomyces rugosispiralis]|uniref:Alpha/beta fold hydrolase n=1 Tax=Streptomyces rugosispiralis TaxID=2967341 RepID=A0ABT1V8Z3_9ACTN|nr:alpha/beta fold hydrolase [Streptomyces rugosispiralis]MCQ8193761.1 alpha/beta fold hydrolase [Streptomyces rugosispiralis]
MSENWLVDLVPAERPERVAYLFPHAGAGVSAVLALGRALAPDPHPVAIRLPGREALLDHAPIADLPAVAKRLADAIRTHAGEARIILYGHSSGSALAYETARALEPETALLLAVSAQQAPGTPVRMAAGCWDFPDDRFFAQVVADGYLPAALLDDPDVLEMVAPALRADYRATYEYLTGTTQWPPVASPILAIRATEDETVAEEDITAWSALTTSGLTTALITAGHNLLRDRPLELAAALRHALP